MRFNSEILVALATQTSNFPLLAQVKGKHSLTLFNVFSPAVIGMLDMEVSANPYVLSEAMNFLEMAEHLGMFYSFGDDHYTSSFVDTVRQGAVKMRLSWNQSRLREDRRGSLHTELMDEYFVTDGDELGKFLQANPYYMGVYLYLYSTILSMT